MERRGEERELRQEGEERRGERGEEREERRERRGERGEEREPRQQGACAHFLSRHWPTHSIYLLY